MPDEESRVTFADVAGVDEAKTELNEIVDFLKTPERYTAIGARIPKGVLLVGPPGTGKTLLSKAVAGEAGVPFFIISGSEFVELFVGAGAARVRDLFEEAKKKAPCIIFIDELDAIGKSRSGSMGVVGGNDEREQTLNQLLTEMDGFAAQDKPVIVLAATNQPETLDAALLRPGRFDRQVLVDRPDLSGRKMILDIYGKKVKLGRWGGSRQDRPGHQWLRRRRSGQPGQRGCPAGGPRLPHHGGAGRSQRSHRAGGGGPREEEPGAPAR